MKSHQICFFTWGIPHCWTWMAYFSQKKEKFKVSHVNYCMWLIFITCQLELNMWKDTTHEITKDLLLHMWIPHVLILAHLSVSHFTMSTGHLNGLNSKWMFFFHTSWSLGICFFTSNSAFITSDMSFLHVNYRHSCHWMFSHADDTWSQVRFPSSRVDSTSLHNFSCSWIISHGTGHFHKWLALLIYPSFIYKRIFLQE